VFDCVLLHLGYFTFLLLLSTSNNVFDCIFSSFGFLYISVATQYNLMFLY